MYYKKSSTNGPHVDKPHSGLISRDSPNAILHSLLHPKNPPPLYGVCAHGDEISLRPIPTNVGREIRAPVLSAMVPQGAVRF